MSSGTLTSSVAESWKRARKKGVMAMIPGLCSDDGVLACVEAWWFVSRLSVKREGL